MAIQDKSNFTLTNIVQIIGIQDILITKTGDNAAKLVYATAESKEPQLARGRADKTKGRRPILVGIQDFRKIK